jgi:DNA-binding transcriptional MerR regulator
MDFKIGDVARLAGVSVRALHHYDEIGLVRPSTRNAAGYRLYAPSDLGVPRFEGADEELYEGRLGEDEV